MTRRGALIVMAITAALFALALYAMISGNFFMHGDP